MAALSDMYQVISEKYGEPTFFYTLKNDSSGSINLQWSFKNAKADIEALSEGVYFDDSEPDILIFLGENRENDPNKWSDRTKQIIARQVGLPYELIDLVDADADNFYRHKKGIDINMTTKDKDSTYTRRLERKD